MRKEITAKWARETAESILNEKANNQLEKVLDLIEDNVKANYMYCTYYVELEDKVIIELEKRGFTVKHHIAMYQMDDDSYTISW